MVSPSRGNSLPEVVVEADVRRARKLDKVNSSPPAWRAFNPLDDDDDVASQSGPANAGLVPRPCPRQVARARLFGISSHVRLPFDSTASRACLFFVSFLFGGTASNLQHTCLHSASAPCLQEVPQEISKMQEAPKIFRQGLARDSCTRPPCSQWLGALHRSAWAPQYPFVNLRCPIFGSRKKNQMVLDANLHRRKISRFAISSLRDCWL